jgi:hypothetical protein
VARKGAKRPIFEGNMPPKKTYPQYWRRYRPHNRNPVLIETKSFGGIWSFGEDSMGLYVGGRQIFETSQEVHKRGG